jgi:hypothetical protein
MHDDKVSKMGMPGRARLMQSRNFERNFAVWVQKYGSARPAGED